MDRYCSECNSNMTPSLVGYLCSECGHVQRFYTDSSALVEPLIRRDENISTNVSASDEISRSKPTANDNEERRKIRSTLKRLMVPELPPPHHEQIIGNLSEKEITSAPHNTPFADSLGNQEINTPSLKSEAKNDIQDFEANSTDSKEEHKKHTGVWISVVTLVLGIIGLSIVGYLYFLR